MRNLSTTLAIAILVASQSALAEPNGSKTCYLGSVCYFSINSSDEVVFPNLQPMKLYNCDFESATGSVIYIGQAYVDAPGAVVSIGSYNLPSKIQVNTNNMGSNTGNLYVDLSENGPYPPYKYAVQCVAAN